MRNWFCEKCWDTGEIGFFRKSTCPECDGDPRGTWDKTHPLPMPPVGGSGEVSCSNEVHLYIHNVNS